MKPHYTPDTFSRVVDAIVRSSGLEKIDLCLEGGVDAEKVYRASLEWVLLPVLFGLAQAARLDPGASRRRGRPAAGAHDQGPGLALAPGGAAGADRAAGQQGAAVSRMSKADRLRELIAKTIEEDPHEFEGFIWGARPQDEWCRDLCSLATLRRMTAQPPFVRDCRHVDGRKMTLLREGEPGPKTARQLAKTMSYVWRKRFGRSVGRHDFGCLVGLAEKWPAGHEVEIFKLVLDNWPAFMVGVKLVIAVEGGKELYLATPSIATMRKYHKVGIEMDEMQWQAKKAKSMPLMA